MPDSAPPPPPPPSEEDLRRGVRRLDWAQRVAHIGSWEWNLATGEVSWTDETYRLFGYAPGAVRPTYDTFLARCHEDDRARMDRTVQDSVRTGRPFSMLYRVVHPDGRPVWLYSEGEVVGDAGGRATRLLGVVQDVTERKRREVWMLRERDILERIARSAPLAETLTAITELVEDRAAGMLTSILLLDDEGRLRHGAAPSLPEPYNRAVDGIRIGPKVGSCGTAAYLRQTVVTADIATDPLWEGYREMALENGLASSWSTPLYASDGRVIGTLAQYYREPRDPTPRDAQAVDIARHLAEIAIERHQGESALRAARDELEQRVRERTAELQRTNEAMADEITARRRAEQELRRREGALAEAQRLTHCGSWEWDVDRDEVRWSEELYRIFGLEPNAFGATFEAYLARVVPEDRPRVREAILHAVRNGQPFAHELRVARPDGEVRFVTSRGSVELDADGHVSRMVGTCVDVTETRRVEAEIRALNAELEQRVERRTEDLARANRELETFSYTVTHDLRAPLRSIDGFARLLLEGHADQLDAAGQAALARLRTASTRMGQLIDDILRLSRVALGELHVEEVDLSAIAREVAQSLLAGEPSRRVDFVVPDKLVVYGDRELLRIVMENLLDNAWKYTRRHATARIEVGERVQDGQRVIFVRDDGAGFDPRYAGQLFKPFSRLHGEEEFEGTGIGLATVLRIVERHGGRAWAEGAVEKGATVAFTLPA